uniref:Ig-like domain-containing protein n=1 Tax=Oreochromis niloticus TaxID=8128 RepID=A0A669CXQ0_ORENI
MLFPDVHSAASLTVSPDRVQHFTSDSVSLTCEGNFTEWRVRKFSEDGRLYSDCRRMTGSTCNINTSKSDTAVYWCESGSGEFSSAVNITVQNDGNGPILVSPVHPVTEGASVSLSCSLRTQKILSNVFFYHNDKLIQNDTRGELKISAVSKSDEGFYKCQYSGRESAQSWMSVKVTVSGADSSSSPVWLIVGLVCGVFLIIILLLLLYCCTTTNCETFSFTYYKHSNTQMHHEVHIKAIKQVTFYILIKVLLMSRCSVRMKISSKCTPLFFMVSFSCSFKYSDAVCNKTVLITSAADFNINVICKNICV